MGCTRTRSPAGWRSGWSVAMALAAEPSPADPRRADHRAGPRRSRRRWLEPGGRASARTSPPSVLFISHNLAVIAKMCDRVGVPVRRGAPRRGTGSAGVRGGRATPYTVGLLPVHPPPRSAQGRRGGWTRSLASCRPPGTRLPGCVFAPRLPDRRTALPGGPGPPAFPVGPRPGAHAATPATTPRRTCPGTPRSTLSWPSTRDPAELVVSLRDLSKTLHPTAASRCGPWSASTSASSEAETLGLVGESGSGKTTLARAPARPHRARTKAPTWNWTGPQLAAEAAAAAHGSSSRRCRSCSRTPDSALNRRPHRPAPDQPAAVPAGRPVRGAPPRAG